MHLAKDCMAAKTPLTFFKNFIVEKDGKYKNRLDLKTQGLTTSLTLPVCWLCATASKKPTPWPGLRSWRKMSGFQGSCIWKRAMRTSSNCSSGS